MTILVFGAGGQVGHELLRTLAPLDDVVPLTHSDVDLADEQSLRDAVRRRSPAVIVNAAAYTAVDKAEADVERAYAINARAPGILAEEAEACGAVLVHYSTDYVFDGRKPGPYREDDETAPLSVYGGSKRDGEIAVSKCRRSLVFRTSWVYGLHGNNFVKTIVRLAREHAKLRVVSDQIGAPTSAALIAEVTARVLTKQGRKPAEDPAWGLYHLVTKGDTSWHAFAQYLVAGARALGLPLQASPESIESITTAEYGAAAPRPANSRLSTEKIETVFSIKLPDWKAEVDRFLEQWAKTEWA